VGGCGIVVAAVAQRATLEFTECMTSADQMIRTTGLMVGNVLPDLAGTNLPSMRSCRRERYCQIHVWHQHEHEQPSKSFRKRLQMRTPVFTFFNSSSLLQELTLTTARN